MGFHIRLTVWIDLVVTRAIGPDLIDAAVLTGGPEAYRRKDGIAVIPLALLGL